MSGLSRSRSRPWLPKPSDVADRAGGEAVLQRRTPVARDGVAERVARHDVARALRGAGRVEDAEAAAQHRLVVAVRCDRRSRPRGLKLFMSVLISPRADAERSSASSVRPSACAPGGSSAPICAFGTTWWPPSVRTKLAKMSLRSTNVADHLVAQAEKDRQLRRISFQSSCTNSAQSFENVSIGRSPRVLRCSRTVLGRPSRKSANELPVAQPLKLYWPFESFAPVE